MDSVKPTIDSSLSGRRLSVNPFRSPDFLKKSDSEISVWLLVDAIPREHLAASCKASRLSRLS